MYPVPQDESSLNAIRTVEPAKIYIDGLRPVQGTNFFDSNGVMVLDPATSSLSRNINELLVQTTGLTAFSNKIGDIFSDAEYALEKKCLCVP